MQLNAGMPVTITIRHVPESVRDELASRAARSGRSLQEYLSIQLHEMAARPSVEQVLARARARVKLADRSISAEDILTDRDAERR